MTPADAAWDAEIDARGGRHEGIGSFLDDVLVPINYTPQHRADVAA